MTPGQIVNMKSMEIILDGGIKLKFRAKKDEKFAVIYLGVDTKNTAVDAESVLRRLGWVPASET